MYSEAKQRGTHLYSSHAPRYVVNSILLLEVFFWVLNLYSNTNDELFSGFKDPKLLKPKGSTAWEPELPLTQWLTEGSPLNRTLAVHSADSAESRFGLGSLFPQSCCFSHLVTDLAESVQHTWNYHQFTMEKQPLLWGTELQVWDAIDVTKKRNSRSLVSQPLPAHWQTRQTQ